MTLCLALGAAHASGYYLAKAEGLYGTSELGEIEAGFGLSLYSDDLEYWMTFGSPRSEPVVPAEGIEPSDGHRVREWWLQGSWSGAQLGEEPAVFRDATARKSQPIAPFLVPMQWWRFGTDHTTRRKLMFDQSNHLGFSVPGLWGASAQRFHFGPTLGFGLNLTWWDRWKDSSEITVNTGKVTAEAGWIAGVAVGEAGFLHGRATGFLDLFGIHQSGLDAAAAAGVFLGRLGVPVGIEMQGEYDRGNDTVTTLPATVWAARAALVWKEMVDEHAIDPDEVRQLLEDIRKESTDEGEDL